MRGISFALVPSPNPVHIEIFVDKTNVGAIVKAVPGHQEDSHWILFHYRISTTITESSSRHESLEEAVIVVQKAYNNYTGENNE